jgi:hypothetical protein
MEAIGAAASIVTLFDLTKKIYEFWKAIDDAPAEIREITEDALGVKCITEQILIEYNKTSTHHPYITEALQQSESKMQRLLLFFQGHDIDSLSKKRRTWAAIKAAFKKDKIIKFRALLESLKASLILTQSLVSK